MRLLVAVPVLLLAGCATIFTGTTDKMTFSADVPGVRLSLDGRYLGELPLTVDVSRNFTGGRKFIALFEAPGYQPQSFPLNQDFNPVAILDISSPLTSGGVDVLTGALLKFSPTDYHVKMLPAGQKPTARFQRSVELDGFALASAERLRTDLARGGGEHLDTFALRVADGDPQVARLVEQRALEHAPALVECDARTLLAKLQELVRDDATLRAYAFD